MLASHSPSFSPCPSSSLTLSLFLSRTRAPRRVLSIPPLSRLSLFSLSFSLCSSFPTTFALVLALARYIPLSRVAANSTPPLTPIQCRNVSLSSVHLHPSARPPSPTFALGEYPRTQSRTRNLIQNVPNAIHIIILVADNGKFV